MFGHPGRHGLAPELQRVAVEERASVRRIIVMNVVFSVVCAVRCVRVCASVLTVCAYGASCA